MEEELTELEETYGKDINIYSSYELEVYFPSYVAVFELSDKYPTVEPTVTIYKKDEIEVTLTEKIQQEAKKYTGEYMLEVLIEFCRSTFPEEKKKLKPQKENQKKKESTREKQQKLQHQKKLEKKERNQRIMEEKMRLKEEKKKKDETKVIVDPSVLGWTNYSKKKKPKIVKTQDEIDALAVSGASGTILELVQKLEKLGDSKEEMTEILSNIKGLGNRCLNPEYLNTMINMRSYIDAMKVITYYSANEKKENPFVIEILIYASFFVSKASHTKEVVFDLYRMNIYEMLWNLGKRKTKQIRQHMNDVLSKISLEKTFSRDMLKALNNPDYSDFKFICSNGTEFFAHKCILRVRTVDIDLSKDCMVLPKEIEPIAVEKFLQFIYANSVFFEVEELKEGLDSKLNEKGINQLVNYSKDTTFFKDSLGKKSLTYSTYDQSMGRIYGNPDYSDVKFSMIKNPEIDESAFIDVDVNKIILSCRSEFFKNMFKSGLSETTSDVIPIDFGFHVMHPVLTHIYTGGHQHLTNSNVIETLIAADLYMLHSLKIMCEERIVETIDLSNYHVLKDIAMDYNCGLLEEGLEKFFNKNESKLINSD
eukprot:gene7843-12316_t